MDHMIFTLTSPDGYLHLLVCTCRATNLRVGFMMQDKTAPEIHLDELVKLVKKSNLKGVQMKLAPLFSFNMATEVETVLTDLDCYENCSALRLDQTLCLKGML